MKRLLLPIALICFTVLCLLFIHIDNIGMLDQEKIALDKQNTKNYTEKVQ